MSLAGGIAGLRIGKPEGVIIHNDAGSINMTAKNWERIYKGGWDFTKGFCHTSIDKDYICIVELDKYKAYHCGAKENATFLSCEVCQSMGADTPTFLANEDNALRWVAKKFKYYVITPNVDTVKLHQEVYATACPHRSVELHGGTVASCKEYFIRKIREYMNEQPIKKGEEDMIVLVTKGNTITSFDLASKVYKDFSTKNQYQLFKDSYKKIYGRDVLEFISDDKHKYYETFVGICKNNSHEKIYKKAVEDAKKEILAEINKKGNK